MVNNSANKERLLADLRYFRLQLEMERDPFRRNLLMGQIRDVQLEIYNLLQQERAQVEQENKNLEDALNLALQMKKK